MKLALCTAVAAALAAGCSVSHRSSDFACDGEQRCAAGRTCVDGFCVIAGDSGVVDTPLPPGDAGACPAQCTSCNTAQKICTIDCSAGNAACDQAIACPAGWICNVGCSVANQCNSGVSCGNATSCTITCSAGRTCRTVTCGRGRCNVSCSGNASCGNAVTCGTGPCNIDCAGNMACDGEIACGDACACDVACKFGVSCFGAAIMCKPGCLSAMPPLVCTSTSTATDCNTCP